MRPTRTHDQDLTARRQRAREDRVRQCLVAERLAPPPPTPAPPPAAPARLTPDPAPPAAPVLSREDCLAEERGRATARAERAEAALQEMRERLAEVLLERDAARAERDHLTEYLRIEKESTAFASEVQALASQSVAAQIAAVLQPSLGTLHERIAGLKVGRLFGVVLQLRFEQFSFKDLPGDRRRRELVDAIWAARRRGDLAFLVRVELKGGSGVSSLVTWRPPAEGEAPPAAPAEGAKP